MKNEPDKLRGNSAKIDPAKKIIGLNVTNTVTMSEKTIHGTPVVDDENVAYAKKFVEENKK